ncbi:hypothetical protein HYPSUDRAFT_56002 [Hypholoma sublateritium FD-334 SS-4]|uniref:Uncharacterized protein n=1 Tax=Hypholoma sublateritium (strain FD-334 SS-4) TaxID=945553 RepID=A0A0D2NVK2_HYPSF|nr:hypothetical protein HYPSUDRAFT_56002 [Hypholoma sublateritium FD-334 SS-4]
MDSVSVPETTTKATAGAGETTQPGNVEVEPDVIDSKLAESVNVALRGDLSDTAAATESTESPVPPLASTPAPAIDLDSPSDSISTIPLSPTASDNIMSSTTLMTCAIQRPITPRNAHPGSIGMPTSAMSIPPTKISATVLSELTLHSPSSQIVGTPFATSTSPTRFEYPFPDTPSPQTDSTSGSLVASPNPMLLSSRPTVLAGSSHTLVGSLAGPLPPSLSHSPSPPPAMALSTFPLPGSEPLSLIHPQAAARSVSLPHAGVTAVLPVAMQSLSADGYTSKLRAQANAEVPIPPSLSKKRLGWGLDLLMRRGADNLNASARRQTSPPPAPE